MPDISPLMPMHQDPLLGCHDDANLVPLAVPQVVIMISFIAACGDRVGTKRTLSFQSFHTLSLDISYIDNKLAGHWNGTVFILTKFPSLEVVILTTSRCSQCWKFYENDIFFSMWVHMVVVMAAQWQWWLMTHQIETLLSLCVGEFTSHQWIPLT